MSSPPVRVCCSVATKFGSLSMYTEVQEGFPAGKGLAHLLLAQAEEGFSSAHLNEGFAWLHMELIRAVTSAPCPATVRTETHEQNPVNFSSTFSSQPRKVWLSSWLVADFPLL